MLEVATPQLGALIDHMPTVTMTTFVDFVSATGTARITRARAAKKMYTQGYDPQTDFYKPLRDRMERCFTDGWDTAALKKALGDVTDPKKVDNYEEARKGLTKWVGRKTITVKPALKGAWSSGGLEVAINPELHADVNGDDYLIKHYLRTEPLSKKKADLGLHLLGIHAPEDTTVGILDVRRSKLFVPTVEIQDADALLEAEAIAFATLWSRI